jgi:hypothetical protein
MIITSIKHPCNFYLSPDNFKFRGVVIQFMQRKACNVSKKAKDAVSKSSVAWAAIAAVAGVVIYFLFAVSFPDYTTLGLVALVALEAVAGMYIVVSVQSVKPSG